MLVPEIYFKENFNLSSKSTFFRVYENDSDSNQIGDINKIQSYLDIVENELSYRLNKRFNSFFEGLQNLSDLHGLVKDAFTFTNELNDSLERIESHIVNENIIYLQRQVRKQNLEKVNHKLKLIQKINNTVPIINDLVENDDLLGAIEYINQIKSIIKKDLIGLNCIKRINNQIQSISLLVEEKLLSRFSKLCCGENDIPSISKDQLRPLIEELIHQNKLSNGIEAYRISQEKNIRSCLSKAFKSLPSPVNSPSDKKNQGYIKRIGLLDSDSFLSYMDIVYMMMIKNIRRSKYVQDFILSELKRISKNNNTNSKDYDNLDYIKVDVRDMLNGIYDYVNSHIMKIFKSRKEQNKKFTSQKFSEFHNISLDFIKNCEVLFNRESTLRGALLVQRRSFIDHVHSNNLSKLSMILESETFIRAEIANEFATILNCLMDPNSSLFFERTEDSRENTKDIKINNEKFILLNCSLLFSKMIYDYLVILEYMPTIYVDIITRISELFRSFNSKLYQLVLGRGAVKLSNVKTISATHLALVCQTISLVITLWPNIQERIKNYLVDPQKEIVLFQDLENVMKDYVTHRQEIFVMFVSMMGSRLETLFKGYKIMDYSKEPSKPFVDLFEKTKSLHKILKALIHKEHFQLVFKQIMSVYYQKLSVIFMNLGIKTPKEKEKLLNDVIYLSSKFKELDGIDDPSDMLIEFVHSEIKV